ncbi:MAG: hypothetical protein N3G21_06300 [Candidatus Hydrogenedentes bacterium]|nr:hypothetical protein [Candidatus Hydrogenedentota bacterium]
MLDRISNNIDVTFIFIISVLLLTRGIFADTQNLVTNGGFENVRENQPLHWNLYLEPNEGSYGGIDRNVFNDGSQSVFISHIRHYKVEPLNNWNQRISTSENLRKLLLSGYIKTKEATKAYFLLQFWNKNGRIVNSVKTEEVTGTNDWVNVTKECKVPEGTNFIMLRCVLEGVGTVWFDNVTLSSDSSTSSEPASEDISVILEKLDRIEKEINNVRGEYIYLRNRVEELEKRLYNRLEKMLLPEVDVSPKNFPQTPDKQQILPPGITLEDIQK